MAKKIHIHGGDFGGYSGWSLCKVSPSFLGPSDLTKLASRATCKLCLKRLYLKKQEEAKEILVRLNNVREGRK